LISSQKSQHLSYKGHAGFLGIKASVPIGGIEALTLFY